jgi:hypothetical protein
VAVEAERPSIQQDVSAGSATQSSLDAIGIRTVDGRAVRANRRPLADSAVARGMHEDHAKAAIDHLDCDFIVRVQSSGSAPTIESVYGVDFARAESSLAITVLHGLQETVVRSFAISASRQSRSPSTAQRDAEASARNDAAVTIAGAVTSDWISIGQNARPWIVEILQPDPAIATTAPDAATVGVRVLEYRPGIRVLLEVPEPQVAEVVASWSIGHALQTRPGFVRVQGRSAGLDWRVAWVAIGTAVASVMAILLVARARARRAPVHVGPV